MAKTGTAISHSRPGFLCAAIIFGMPRRTREATLTPAFSMNSEQRTVTLGAAIVAAVLSLVAGADLALAYRNPPKLVLGVAGAVAAQESSSGLKRGSEAAPPADSIELSDTQLKSVKVETAGERDFPIEKVAIGSIDFKEELLTQGFTPNRGRMVGLFAKVGDEVLKGQTLFTIDSPDLVQASSTLISARAAR